MPSTAHTLQRTIFYVCVSTKVTIERKYYSHWFSSLIMATMHCSAHSSSHEVFLQFIPGYKTLSEILVSLSRVHTLQA